MHFHKPLMDLFRQKFGLGNGGKINFYKYSPQKEVFVGFDQAYAMTELSDDDFFQMLKESATTKSYKLPKTFVAYFLQFKVVKKMTTIRKQTPEGISTKPHYRSTLDTTRNQKTGFSQHELLHQLSHNEGAIVYYACPMLFDKADLYAISVDLTRLRLADVLSCPLNYSDNQAHYIYFDTPTSDPIWCSDPVEGKAVAAADFVSAVTDKLLELDPARSAEALLSLLTRIRGLPRPMGARSSDVPGEETALALVHDSLTIIELERAQQ
jgi:hypothetical protein